jgi:hypothetical protein
LSFERAPQRNATRSSASSRSLAPSPPQRELPLREKVRLLLELQKIDYAIRSARGDAIEPWQKPWEIEP